MNACLQCVCERYRPAARSGGRVVAAEMAVCGPDARMRVAAGVVDLRIALLPAIDEDAMPSEVCGRPCATRCGRVACILRERARNVGIVACAAACGVLFRDAHGGDARYRMTFQTRCVARRLSRRMRGASFSSAPWRCCTHAMRARQQLARASAPACSCASCLARICVCVALVGCVLGRVLCVCPGSQKFGGASTHKRIQASRPGARVRRGGGGHNK